MRVEGRAFKLCAIGGRIVVEDEPMKTIETLSAADQAKADSEEIARHVVEGRKVTDPELRRRVTERADAVRREMLARHGVMNIAVDLLRECRDED